MDGHKTTGREQVPFSVRGGDAFEATLSDKDHLFLEGNSNKIIGVALSQVHLHCRKHASSLVGDCFLHTDPLQTSTKIKAK